MKNEKILAIVVAAGKGRRMESQVKKQYMLLQGKPLLYYSLKAFEENPNVDEIVIVVEAEEIEYCKKDIVDAYKFNKAKYIVQGGAERSDSVYAGLKAVTDCQIVLIHDGARPFLTNDMIERAIAGAKQYNACVLGMPVKDTIKIADKDGFAKLTPDRELVWMIQTPQAFSYALILKAYEKLFLLENRECKVTDDAMVVETMMGICVKLLEGSYKNIKITTPEDMLIATVLCTLNEE